MTTREASLSVGIMPWTLYKHLQDGTLPGEKLGGRWEISSAALMAWAWKCWETNAYTMLPPDRAAAFIQEYKLN